MLRAVNMNGEPKVSWKDTIKKNDSYFCPDCKHDVSFVNATFKIKHFRHMVASNCDPEPETQEHIEMKLFMQQKLNLTDDQLEVSLGFGKPDLLMKNYTQQRLLDTNGQGSPNIAIEVQHSKFSYDAFIKRTENYTKNNYYVIWIFHEKLLKELMPEFLKKAHEIYFGRIYVYKNKNIYPVHAESTKTWVEEYEKKIFVSPEEFAENGYEPVTETVGGFYKFNKKKKSYNYGSKITDFSFTTTKNVWKLNNYKIARFKDVKFWSSDYDKD